jgi:hypothetical protein
MEMQQASLEYQYDVVFKTIMDQERFEQEAKKLKIDRNTPK